MPDDFYVVVGENRRLLREVKELRARVTDLESSRWWRVHPRFLLRRMSKPAAASEGAVAAPEAVPTAAAQDDDPLLARFRREVVARGSFRDEQSVANARTWEQFLQQLEGREARILEIGSFEGMSACYFLWRLPDAHVTCVDTFAGASSFVARGDTCPVWRPPSIETWGWSTPRASAKSPPTRLMRCSSCSTRGSASTSSSSTVPISRST